MIFDTDHNASICKKESAVEIKVSHIDYSLTCYTAPLPILKKLHNKPNLASKASREARGERGRKGHRLKLARSCAQDKQ